jgi:hypothetical protein
MMRDTSYCGVHSAGFTIVWHVKSVELDGWNISLRRLAIWISVLVEQL